MKKKVIYLVGVAFGLLILVSIIISVYTNEETARTDESDTLQISRNEFISTENNKMIKSETNQNASEEVIEIPSLDNLSPSEKRHLIKMVDYYLEKWEYSRAGIIEVMQAGNYSYEEAIYAAYMCDIDWNEQALKRAKRSLRYGPSSYSGLIEELIDENFEYEEAVYAADNCGADWYEQAALKAEKLLKKNFTKQEMIEELEYYGFTNEQAVYGAEENEKLENDADLAYIIKSAFTTAMLDPAVITADDYSFPESGDIVDAVNSGGPTFRAAVEETLGQPVTECIKRLHSNDATGIEIEIVNSNTIKVIITGTSIVAD
ncbi:MAG: Ltp family lipoprotein [Lachnospiraceae bacterium]|nr:Ltp family lipoprotein [Lachnospiraceae bacterium]